MHWWESSRNFAAHGYLLFFTDCIDKRLQGRVPFGESMEVIFYHFFIIFELFIIVKLNHNHLHENENAEVEINNSKSSCVTKNVNIKAQIQFSLLCVFFSGINGKLLFVSTCVNE